MGLVLSQEFLMREANVERSATDGAAASSSARSSSESGDLVEGRTPNWEPWARE